MTEEVTTPEVPEGIVQTGAEAATVSVPTDPPEEDLLAGKFKSQEDLEKGYLELAKKLGEKSEPVTPEPEANAEDNTDDNSGEDNTDNSTDEDGEASPYGEVVDAALAAAEVDPAAANQEFIENGTLSDETFEKFEKAGFPRTVVEAYLRGAATSEQAAEITTDQITGLKAKAGGEEGFTQLQEWMAQNVEADDLKAYNDALDSGDFNQITAQVDRMVALRQAAFGSEGDLLGGKTTAAEAGYKTEAEMLADMAKPEYKSNAAFREQVAAKIAKSPALMVMR